MSKTIQQNDNQLDGKADSSPSSGSAGVLTMAAIAAAISNMPPKPLWCEAVMNVESYERLRSDPALDAVPMGDFYGMPIYCKPGQVVAAWMFSDRATAKRYLEDELSELDLMDMVRTGKCQPNKPDEGSSGDDAQEKGK